MVSHTVSNAFSPSIPLSLAPSLSLYLSLSLFRSLPLSSECNIPIPSNLLPEAQNQSKCNNITWILSLIKDAVRPLLRVVQTNSAGELNKPCYKQPEPMTSGVSSSHPCVLNTLNAYNRLSVLLLAKKSVNNELNTEAECYAVVSASHSLPVRDRVTARGRGIG